MTMTVDEKIKALSAVAEKRGYITYGEINAAFPDSLFSADELDGLYLKLRNLEIEVRDMHQDCSRN